MSRRRDGISHQPVAHLVSLGCAKNLVDSELMLGALAQAGYAVSASAEGADVVILNTCGFVRDAVDEAEEEIARLAELRRAGVCGKLVVAGCLAQRNKQELRERFPEIDVLLGAAAAADIATVLRDDVRDAFPPKTALPDHTHARLPSTPPWTAYLRTAEGCSNRCAYCIIPMLRGDFRSRTPESLEHEARDLVRLGVRELVLVAQDNTRFGLDLKPPASLPLLLRRLDRVPKLRWLRVMYCHPARVDENLLQTMSDSEKVLPYLDIPMQHAHPEILRAMNRPGDPEQVLRIMDRSRELMPQVCIRTTMLVGFPGETDTHFKSLLEFVERARFDHLGAFRYSPEPEAPAAFLPNQVREEVKSERYHQLMTAQSAISLEKNRAWIAGEITVLTEGPGPAPGMTQGRTFRHAPDIDGMAFIAGSLPPGRFIRARVVNATNYDLITEPVDTQKSRG